MMFHRKPAEPVKALTPAQMERAKAAELIALEADLKRQELETAAAFRAELAENERNAKRAELAQTAKAEKASQWKAAVQRFAARAVPYTPLFLVNTMAILGQVGWGRHNLTQAGSSPEDLIRWVVALLFAAALESIALFLIYYANRALQNRDSANGLYLAAFAVASLVAGINYSHYANPDEVTSVLLWNIPAPTPMAVVFAMCSLISPWLWRIHHRAENREALKAAGEIDVRAVKLSMARKAFNPVRSYKVIRRASWTGITNPAEAVADWEAFQAARKEAKAERAAAKAAAKAAREGAKAQGADKASKEAPAAPSKPEAVMEVVREDVEPEAVMEPVEAPPALPAATPPVVPAQAPPLPEAAIKWPEAWKVYTLTFAANNPISQRKLASHMNNNRSGARELITAHEEWRHSVNGSRTTAP